MRKVWLTADTHFGHGNILSFVGADGCPVRPFSSVEEMDEALVDGWNSVVSPEDKVYHLGDVAIPRKSIAMMGRLHGRKVLIRGNHDIYKLSDYTPYFKGVRAYHVLNGWILSHVPIHPGSLGRFKGNIHGHTHGNKVVGDDRYVCVCVEQTGYKPVPMPQ